ncbi:hypothetical protein BK133_02355 [Paenibacillus sp. FSL H8-0548]|uniref:hypothetical protein n=1 Tax=Paenibacillus sp. FSL H8-0548 TaxID=1920422 RepID=UPI00096FB38B|nr:hypothetical protein [Paenibacillus sp. FSL H8-0548]OMF38384.1 hypothetical protein BK133_02355 [Paenibacillus sp. FSL H8-0548]
MKRMRMISVLIVPLLILMLAATGCTSTTLKNVDMEPSTQGLLAALQKEQMTAASDLGYQVTITDITESEPRIGKSDLYLHVLDSAGQPVTEFKEDMTKLMHLIAVSKDLSSFQHVHPELVEGNLFHAQLDFPFASPYLVTTEFRPNKAEATVHKQWLQISGTETSNEPLLPEQVWQKEMNGLQITLSASPALSEMKAGQMVMLLFRIMDTETGKPINKIEPFLGTSGHCVILSSDAQQYVHAHAMEAMSGGANVMFHTVFPQKGIYKLWGQFQYNGEVITVPFVVKVN